MILRATFAAALSMLTIAPFQCGGRDPDPALRMEDTAGDALWDLAERFKAEHKDDAAREALTYLVEKYPSSRHVVAAKEELAQMGGPSPASSAAPADDGGS
jgi:hypothetical protein